MGLESEITLSLLNFYSKFYTEKIYRNEDCPEQIEFELSLGRIIRFAFEIKKENRIRILISPFLRQDSFTDEEEYKRRQEKYQSKFIEYILSNQGKVNKEKYPVLGQHQEEYHASLSQRNFSKNSLGDCIFVGEFKSDNSEERFYGVLNLVVKPVLLFYKEEINL